MSLVSHVILSCFLLSSVVSSFSTTVPTSLQRQQLLQKTREPKSESYMTSSALKEEMTHLYNPTRRDEYYGKNPNNMNVAQYLVDLHDSKATFNFCGGMMFQLVLSDKLRHYLVRVAASQNKDDDDQPIIFDANKSRMSVTPNYSQSAFADNVQIFHGREVRKVPTAAGGMGFVLLLSMANAEDPQGWTKQEVEGYDGWGHDVGRDWRTGDRLAEEGFKTFQTEFGKDAFALHHRFYLHMDKGNSMWLSAEDGCEGTPQGNKAFPFSGMFGGVISR